jgi:hypothetical protein
MVVRIDQGQLDLATQQQALGAPLFLYRNVSAGGVVALGRGALRLGALLADLDASEIEEYLNNRAAWDERYDAGRRLPPAG